MNSAYLFPSAAFPPHTRNKAAMADGLTFAVEWSDSLANGTWNTVDVTEQILTTAYLLWAPEVAD